MEGGMILRTFIAIPITDSICIRGFQYFLTRFILRLMEMDVLSKMKMVLSLFL